MRQRSQYYRALQTTQSGSMDITAWMIWFLDCLTSAMNNSGRTADAALSQAKLQPFAQANSLNERQVKVVGRLIEGGRETSRPTATGG